MKRTFSYTISPDFHNCTVKDFLLSQGYSRHLITSLKKEPTYLCVNGLSVFTNYKLKMGEQLLVTFPVDTPSAAVLPVQIPLCVVYEDDDLLVINKPANMPIHPSQGNYTNSLANAAAWYFKEKGEPFTCRIINRLDRDTTGLLILAKHPLSACILSQMIQDRQIHRAYLAAVQGLLLPGVSGIINAPIGRVNGSTIERKVDFENGEDAITHYYPVSYLSEMDASLVALKLETGRTHQIRVHMKYLGHPLYGDFLYNPDYRYIKRQSLHSWRLAFSHPITKEPLTFTAAVPNDMKCFTLQCEDLLDNDFL